MSSSAYSDTEYLLVEGEKVPWPLLLLCSDGHFSCPFWRPSCF